MILNFLAFGGLLFWAFAALAVISMTTLVNSEKYWQTALATIGSIAILVAFSDLPIVQTIKDHPTYLVYSLLGYIGIAAVWAIIKWRAFFLPNLFDAYNELRDEFLKNKGLKEMPADPAVTREFLGQGRVQRLDINHARMVRNNKARVTAWMFFWPFSLLGTFVGDFLQRVFATIYKHIAGLLQGMSDRMASKYSELN